MTVEKKTIGLIGACRGSGTTYLSLAIADAMAKRAEGVAYMESHLCSCPSCIKKPLTFYKLNLQNRIFLGKFSDFFYLKAIGQRTDNRMNIYKGVNWAVRKEDSPCCLLEPEDIAGRYIIWDEPPLFSSYGTDRKIMDKLDLLLCVVRPETEFASAGADTARECFYSAKAKTKLIYNMISSPASLKYAERFIGKKGDFFVYNSSPEREKNIDEIAEYILTLY